MFPPHGLVEVTEVGERELAGCKLAVVGFRALVDGTRLLVPTARLKTSGLRPVATGREVAAVYAVLRGSASGRRPPGYKWHQILWLRLNTGSLANAAEVVRDLVHLKAQRPLSATERRILDVAQDQLLLELSVVTRQSRASLERHLLRLCRTGLKKGA
ncbi:MAG: hypothetical protein HY903_08790 [Deltaproteobacteria bacterium]|nr:hypothetical protein [Deltaproteobacteria bacterium]